MSRTEWSDLAVSELPTGTVTLLLADVEGSTQLWESQPEEMTAAIARLDATLGNLVAAHGGVRPVEQGEGDSFVLAFARASDAVLCASELQRAPLAPIRLRIGVHTGEIQLRDEGNYIGPTINRTARLRDLAHGGQTVLSGVTEAIVVDHLPGDAWLTDARIAGSAATGAGGAAVSPGYLQRFPAVADLETHWCAISSGAVDQFHRA
jgi:class 3 adenylate cyclase